MPSSRPFRDLHKLGSVVWLILNFVIVPATAWCWMMPDFPSPQLSTLPKVRDLTECFPPRPRQHESKRLPRDYSAGALQLETQPGPELRRDAKA